MTNFSSIGGAMLAILGFAITAYGLNLHEPFSAELFTLGIVCAASGGLVVWLGNKRRDQKIPSYEVESHVTDPKADPIRYRNVYDTCPVMLRTVNTSGIILECNTAYVKYFGVSKESIIGKSIFDHTAEKSLDDIKKTFESWKKSGKVDNVEIWLKRKDGTVFPGLLSASNLYDDKGRLIGSNSAIRDVSEIYQARRVLDEHERQSVQLDELKKMNSIKEEFYLMVAKESQIPLEPIRKYSKILSEIPSSNLDNKQLEAVTEIYDNSVRLEQLMHDITTVQKLNSNTMDFKKEKFNVDVLMSEVVESCKQMMKDKKIKFEDSSSIKILITGDKKQLKEVYFNLIQNAVDFVPTTGGKIDIGAKEEGESIVFHVKDNGIGILEKRKDQVFKKFYQVDISFKRKYGGSGFGLVICKGIVENLGGKIWFESKEGEGTTFYFSIPK